MDEVLPVAKSFEELSRGLNSTSSFAEGMNSGVVRVRRVSSGPCVCRFLFIKVDRIIK